MITKVRTGDQRCAKCQNTMQKFSYRWEDLELEVCPNKHGFWLDAGEEEKALHFIEKFEDDLYKKLIHEEDWERKKRNMKSDSWLAELAFRIREKFDEETDFVIDNVRDVVEDLKP